MAGKPNIIKPKKSDIVQSIARILDLLRFEEPQSPIGGGRFLPEHATDWVFFLLRITFICYIISISIDDGSAFMRQTLMISSAVYGFAHVSLFLLKLSPLLKSLGWRVLVASSLTDLVFGIVIAAIYGNIEATIILCLLAGTEASLLGSFYIWISVASASIATATIASVSAGGLPSLFPTGIFSALLLIFRIFRGTQVESLFQLQQERARYESLVEHVPHMIVRKDLDGVITYANTSFCESNGLDLHQVIGKTDFLIYDKELAVKYRNDDKHVIESKEKLRILEKHRLYQKEFPIDIEGWKVPVFDADGKVVEVQIIFEDVTIQKERDIQLSALMRTTRDHIYFKDRDSRFTLISRTMADRFNLKNPADVVGKTDQNFFSSPHAEEALADEREIFSNGRSITKDEKETWPDGSVSWVATTKQAITNEAGEIVGIFGISRDITDRKIAEMRLFGSERLYRLIVENAMDLIYIRGLDGRIRSINNAARRILGYEPAELVGRSIVDIAAPASVNKMRARLDRLEKTQVTSEETELMTRTGEVRTLEFTARALRDREHQEVLVVSIGHDITHRKQLESQLLVAKSSLEHQVRERTKRLHRLSEQLTIAAAGSMVIHDVLNPLLDIQQRIDILRVAAISHNWDKIFTGLENLSAACEFALETIVEIQKVVKKGEVKKTRLDLNSCLKNWLVPLENRQNLEEGSCELSLEEELPLVQINEIMMRTAFGNVFNNAKRYANGANGISKIKIHTFSVGSDSICLEVRDHGGGFSDKLLSPVDLGAGARESEDGLGMGLLIAQRILELHNGSLELRNHEDGGGRVAFIIPIDKI